MRRVFIAIVFLLSSCGTSPDDLNSPGLSENESLQATRPIEESDPTHTPRSEIGCNSTEVRIILVDVDDALVKLERLARKFGDTEDAAQGLPIIEEIDEMFLDVMLWKVPECAEEIHINLALAIENISSALKALMEGDVEGFNRNYGTYAISVEMMNEEYERLSAQIR